MLRINLKELIPALFLLSPAGADINRSNNSDYYGKAQMERAGLGRDGDSGGNYCCRGRPACSALNFPCGKGVKLL